MKPLEVYQTPHTQVICPACGAHDSTVDHLVEIARKRRKPYKAGPWYCDSCSQGYDLEVLPDGTGTIELTNQRMERTLVFLRYHNVGLVVRGRKIRKDGEVVDMQGDQENDAYLYNEHTCPTNYLPEVLAIVDLDGKFNDDPHGIFEHVHTCAIPKDLDIEDPNIDWERFADCF